MVMELAPVKSVVFGSIAFVVFWVTATFPKFAGLPIGRTAGAIVGATLVVVFQVASPDEAYASINLPILGLLFGTMVVSTYLERADMFKYLASALSYRCQGGKDLLCRLSFLVALSSALFTNDTCCVVFTDFILTLCKEKGLPPEPFLLALTTSANLGSSATPIGNPQNLVIAIQSNISFGKFLMGILPAMLVGVTLNLCLLLGTYWKQLSNYNMGSGLKIDELKSVDDLSPHEEVKTLPGAHTEQGQRQQWDVKDIEAQGRREMVFSDVHDSALIQSCLSYSSGRCGSPNDSRNDPQDAQNVDDKHVMNSADAGPCTCDVMERMSNQSCTHHHQDNTTLQLQEDCSTISAQAAAVCLPMPELKPEDIRVSIAGSPTHYFLDRPLPSFLAQSSKLCTASVKACSRRGVWKSCVYIVTLGMLAALLAGLNLSWCTITAAMALVVVDYKDAGPSLEKVSYSLLVFFSGMFMTVDGFNRTGLPATFWNAVEPHARINHLSGMAVLTCVIILLSNIASNVPTVLLLGARVAASTAAIGGGGESVRKAWLILAWASTVAGNLTLVGSAANLIVCEQEAAMTAPGVRHHLSFWRHLKFGLPSTFLTVAVGLPLIRG